MTTDTMNGSGPVDAAPLETNRYELLPGGARLVRLHRRDDGWLREYQRILRIAGQDFLRRGLLPGDADTLLHDMATLLESGGGAVWLLVDAQFRLLGFTAMSVGREAFTGATIGNIPCFYLYPKKTRGYFARVKSAMIAWATAQGVARLYFTSRRPHERAWIHQGAHKVATVYGVDLGGA